MMLGTLVVTSRQGVDYMLLCKMVFVVLFAFFCLVCYAQNQFSNQLEPAKFSSTNQLPCWRRTDGCPMAASGYLNRFSFSDCAGVKLAPDSDKIICVPYLPKTTATVSPPSFSRSIEKLLRSLDNNMLATSDSSSSSNRYEKISSTNPYYTTHREGKKNVYITNNNDGPMEEPSKEENSNECDVIVGNSSSFRRERCLKKYETSEQKIRTNNNIRNALITYQDAIATKTEEGKDDDDIRDSWSYFRRNAASKLPAGSIRTNRDIRGDQTGEGEEGGGGGGGGGRGSGGGGEQQTDISEPAIIIATRGLTYDQLRLRRPTLRLTHKSEGKRQQQVLVDLDGGKKINKSTITSQDAMIRGNKTRGENNHNNNYKSSGNNNSAQETPLECNKRQYTFRAVKKDDLGNECSGIIQATICYGSCDTGEIADWIFPFKKSIHKVCSHGQRVRRRVTLSECSSNSIDPSLREYHYVDARTCVCQKCNPAETTCLGSLTRPRLMSGSEFGHGSSKSDSDGFEQTISEAELIY